MESRRPPDRPAAHRISRTFWRNGSSAVDIIPERLELPGLKEPVRVIFDDRRVPHIFAGSEHDLYLAQGYIMARDRLWQMEFIGRFADGSLAEIVGPAALPHDEFMRRIGMSWAADAFVKAAESDLRTKEPIRAFSDGVNAYIRGLRPRDPRSGRREVFTEFWFKSPGQT